MSQRFRFRLSGEVQGVNLRRNIAAYATVHGLAGWVRNDPGMLVTVEVEGTPEAMVAFRHWLESGLPGLRISIQGSEALEPEGARRFEIVRWWHRLA